MKIGMLQRYPFLPLFCVPVVGGVIALITGLVYSLSFIADGYQKDRNTDYIVTIEKTNGDEKHYYTKGSGSGWGIGIVILCIAAAYSALYFAMFTRYLTQTLYANFLLLNIVGSLFLIPYYKSFITRHIDTDKEARGYSWHFLACIPVSLYLAYEVLTDGDVYGVEYFRGWYFNLLPLGCMIFFGLLAPLSVSLTLVTHYYRAVFIEQGAVGFVRLKNNHSLIFALVAMIFLQNQGYLGVDFFTSESEVGLNQFVIALAGQMEYLNGGVFGLVGGLLFFAAVNGLKTLHKSIDMRKTHWFFIGFQSLMLIGAMGLPVSFLIAFQYTNYTWPVEFVNTWSNEIADFYIDFDTADYYLWDSTREFPFTKVVMRVLGIFVLVYAIVGLMMSQTWQKHKFSLAVYCLLSLGVLGAAAATTEHYGLPKAHAHFLEQDRFSAHYNAEGKSVYWFSFREDKTHQRDFIPYRGITVIDELTGKEVENQLVVDYSNKKRTFIVHAKGYKTKRVTEFDTSQPNNFRWKVTLERESQ